MVVFYHHFCEPFRPIFTLTQTDTHTIKLHNDDEAGYTTVSRFITDQLLQRCVQCRSLRIKVRAFG